MDKNTIIGLVLIMLIVIVYGQLSKPSEAEVAQQQRYSDSIALVQQAQKQIPTTIANDTIANEPKEDSTSVSDKYGEFSPSAIGGEKFYTIENEKIKLTFTNKGGRICSAELKGYRTHDSLPLILFDAKESNMDFTIVTNNNRVFPSTKLYFEPILHIKKDSKGTQTLIFRLQTTQKGYIDFVYVLSPKEYMLHFTIQASAMQTVMPTAINSLEMQWTSKIRQQEKGRRFENQYAGIEYKYVTDNVEKLSTSADEEKRLPNKVKWIAFKDQFFSTILIAEDAFTGTKLRSNMEAEDSPYLKSYVADMTVPFDPTGKNPTSFRLFFGPNRYKILTAYDKGTDANSKLKLNDLIPLGWGIFGWVNKYAIIPMFNFFSGFIANFGLIILLMTLVIKLVLSPLTYKSYISSAKMRVLKPEIDEINQRIPKEKAVERQKATMELYSKVGVNPMSGCVPSLLQIPILYALFSFFPAAIELRQQSFLWAEDLSTYDSVLQLPFEIPFGFGSHVSLFCLLMTITSVVYTKLNMATTSGQEQIPGMKLMMYLMPVVFMFIFNSYASGLSYYYFVSTLISVLQTYVIRATVDEQKLLATLHAKRASNAKTPPKKLGFMERLEKMQYEQQKALKQKRK